MKNMNFKLFPIITVIITMSSAISVAEDRSIASLPAMPAAGATCLACHGAQGISPAPLWPNLAGQKKDYLIKQLGAFKNGSRKDPMMNPLAANLSEAEIESLAQYFSLLSGSGK